MLTYRTTNVAKFADKDDPRYVEALQIIRAGRERLEEQPAAEKADFEPCGLDQWREQKYLTRQRLEEASREAIRRGRSRFTLRRRCRRGQSPSG